LFFPEKREFFLEGAGFFDFSARLGENPVDTEYQGFFSRRIGLSPSGQRIPLLGGGKLTGRLGGLSLGAVAMASEEEGEIGNNSYSVLRVRHDLFSRSSVGGIVTDRSGDGTFSRTAGVDTRLVLLGNLTVEGFFSRSARQEVDGDQNAYFAKAYWRTDLWDIGAGHLTMEPDFDSDLSFIRRADTRKSVADFAYKPRPGISWLRQMELRYFTEYWTNNENRVTGKVNHYVLQLWLENGDQFRIAPHNRYNRLLRSLELFPGVVVPPGDYAGNSVSFRYTVDPSRPLAGSIMYFMEPGYFGGRRTFWRFRPQWKPIPSLILDLDYDFERIRVAENEKRFNVHIVNFGFNYSLSNTLTTSTVFRYSNQSRVKAFNFRLNYIYRPGDDLFVVYRDTRNDLNPELSDRAFLIKFTHSLNF